MFETGLKLIRMGHIQVEGVYPLLSCFFVRFSQTFESTWVYRKMPRTGLEPALPYGSRT